MPEDRPPAVAGALGDLQSTIEAALYLTRELAGDAVIGRLLAAFQAMPEEDRSVVVGAIEREVDARRLSRVTEDVTGQSMVPNPNARLYLRAHQSSLDRNLLERDEMMNATVQAMRVASIIPNVPDIHASWRDATREALGSVEEPTRAVVEQLVREVLELVVEVRAAAAGADSPDQAAATRARSSSMARKPPTSS